MGGVAVVYAERLPEHVDLRGAPRDLAVVGDARNVHFVTVQERKLAL